MMHRFGLFLLAAACLWVSQGNSVTAQGEKKMVKTASGLQYEDVKEGTGATAKAGDTVSVHYTGTLLSNGKKFDSSLDRGEPFEFKLGWDGDQGLGRGRCRHEGGRQGKLVIPSNLAYGKRGEGGSFPPTPTWCSMSNC